MRTRGVGLTAVLLMLYASPVAGQPTLIPLDSSTRFTVVNARRVAAASPCGRASAPKPTSPTSVSRRDETAPAMARATAASECFTKLRREDPARSYFPGVTMESTWSAVDEYFSERLAPNDASLEAALADSAAAGLPAISVTATQGKFLQLLVQIRKARRILEIGTLGGYSTIWMARALPKDGSVVTLEIDDKHAAVAHRNIERAGLRGLVEIRVAPAAESLAQMKRDRVDPYDLVFIDADKASTADYYEAAMALSRPGSLIVIDNVVRHGEVVDADTADVNVQGVRRAVEAIARDGRVSATAVQTVGSKGYDGFILAVVA